MSSYLSKNYDVFVRLVQAWTGCRQMEAHSLAEMVTKFADGNIPLEKVEWLEGWRAEILDVERAAKSQ